MCRLDYPLISTVNPPPKYCTPGYVICLTLNRARGVYYLGGILIGGYGISALSLSPSPSPLFVFSFVIGMQPYPDEWHPASMLMRLLDMLCVHACCTLSLPLPLLAIQFCFVLAPWVILILNLILNYTRYTL